jgi:hypothetical protein
MFEFDETSHTYRLNGVVLPSVTQLLKPIGPDFSMVPPDVLERKRQLGTAVHLACELDDNDELDEIDDALVPYVLAWQLFKAQTGVEILLNERRLHHPVLRYAGTLDRLVSMRGAVWMLDIKTAADPVPSYGAQLAAYVELIHATEGDASLPIRRGTVHLRDDGTYRLAEFKNPNDKAAFMACLSLHQWKEMTK